MVKKKTKLEELTEQALALPLDEQKWLLEQIMASLHYERYFDGEKE